MSHWIPCFCKFQGQPSKSWKKCAISKLNSRTPRKKHRLLTTNVLRHFYTFAFDCVYPFYSRFWRAYYAYFNQEKLFENAIKARTCINKMRLVGLRIRDKYNHWLFVWFGIMLSPWLMTSRLFMYVINDPSPRIEMKNYSSSESFCLKKIFLQSIYDENILRTSWMNSTEKRGEKSSHKKNQKTYFFSLTKTFFF